MSSCLPGVYGDTWYCTCFYILSKMEKYPSEKYSCKVKVIMPQLEETGLLYYILCNIELYCFMCNKISANHTL